MGTVLHNAIALRAKYDDGFHWMPLLELVSHETLHLWNGELLRRHHPKEHYFWFSEGFTEFYTPRILLRQGLIDEADYRAIRHRTIEEYNQSPARHLTNEELSIRFWADHDAQRMTYLRGALFALHLDTELRTRGHSLDLIMAELIDLARRDGIRFHADLLIDHLKPHISGAPELYQSYILNGKSIPTPEEILPH